MLLGQARELRAGAAKYVPLQNEYLDEIARTGDERASFARRSAVDTAIKLGRVPLGDFNANDGVGFTGAVKRARALSKIAAMGDGQVEKQALRDRIMAHNYGRGLRTGSFRSLAAYGDQQQYMRDAKQQAKDMVRDAWAGLAGSVVGMAGRGFEQFRAGRLADAASVSNTAMGYDLSRMTTPSIQMPWAS